MSHLPLHGVRVLDLSQVRAGPKAARWLADAGAEVIKVESLKRPDGRGLRGQDRPSVTLPIPEAEQRKANRSGFDQLHRNKLGLALDLTDPEGVGLFKRLVALSDVVMENFSFGVMERLGLGYEELSRVRPDLIMISMPGFGGSGPDRDYVSFGWAQEHLSGVSAMTGYAGGPPLRTGTITPDPLNGVHAAAAIMTALVHRARTGKGQFIDFSHWESMIALVGDWVLDYAFNGRIGERMGNRHPAWAPQGCYPCRGEDQWVALAVTSNSKWEALCRVMGRPELLVDPRFATSLGRRQHHDALDGLITEWTSQHTNLEAMELLQRAGVPAGAVLDNYETFSNPQTEARGFVPRLTHPDGVSHPYINLPWQFSRASVSVRTPAPLLGEHNHYIFGGILGLSQEDQERLEARGVAATFFTDPEHAATASSTAPGP